MKINNLANILVIIPVVLVLSAAQPANKNESAQKPSFTLAKGQNHLPPRQNEDPYCS